MTYKIDPDFSSLLPPQSDDERARLAIKIELEGCLPGSLTVANIPGEGRYLIDGHNTLAICKDKGLPVCEPRVINFPNREECVEWIINNQLARRNLTDERRA